MRNDRLIPATLSALVAGLLVVAGLGFMPAAGANSHCTGHTDADRKECTGTCPANVRIGVTMNLDDSSESGSATTSCSDETATCPIAVNQDYCSTTSSGTTFVSAAWTCYFEAHDVWWNPDNGFTYNCFTAAPGSDPWSPNLGPGLGKVSCAGLDPADLAGDALLGELCGILADPQAASGVVVPGALQQVVVRAKAGVASGIACDAEAGCWLVQPVCRGTLGGYACEVTPIHGH